MTIIEQPPSEAPAKIPVSAEAFEAALEAAVAERGDDYIYPRVVGEESAWSGDEVGLCRYLVHEQDSEGKWRPTAEPACLIGAALVRLGVDPAQLARFEGASADDVVTELLETPRDVAVPYAAGEAQHVQDTGGTWGEALARARRTLCHGVI